MFWRVVPVTAIDASVFVNTVHIRWELLAWWRGKSVSPVKGVTWVARVAPGIETDIKVIAEPEWIVRVVDR